ncbi:MAG: DUF1629 domain-containing protein [Myxococcota bacterium]
MAEQRWIWGTSPTNEQQERLDDAPLEVVTHGFAFDEGVLITDEIPTLTIRRNAATVGDPADYLMVPGARGFLVSPRLRAVLDSRAVDNIQYFPVRLETPAERSVREDYAIANLVGRVRCIDIRGSELSMDPTHPREIMFADSLALRPDLPDLPMFRAAESARVIVVTEDLQAACSAAGIRGLEFSRPAETTL